MASELEVGKLGVGDITVKDGSDIHLVNTHSNNGADLVFGQLTFGDSSTGQYVNHARIESVGQYANSTDLRFHTSNNDSSPERMRISSTGNVTITGGADSITKVVGTTTGARLDLQTNSHHRFMQVVESNGKFRIYDQTADTERFAISSTGLATFSNGIAFQSATTGSGTGVGYTLENYEYGTFTMGLSGTTATIPSGYETARYYRIGNLVWISWYSGAMTLSSSSGTATLTGLPFNNANNTANGTPFSYTHGNAVDGNSRGGYVVKNENYMQFIDDGSAATATFIDGSSKYIMVSAVYETDDA